MAKVGKCLLGNCQVVLAKCLADGECVENLICLQLCNGRADETACQVITLAPVKSPADHAAHLPGGAAVAGGTYESLGSRNPQHMAMVRLWVAEGVMILPTHWHWAEWQCTCQRVRGPALRTCRRPCAPCPWCMQQALRSGLFGHRDNTKGQEARLLLTSLQIRCGDLYADKAVEAFTACAVSDKKCVPQRVDESTFPEPPPTALDTKFDLNNFQVCRPPVLSVSKPEQVFGPAEISAVSWFHTCK